MSDPNDDRTFFERNGMTIAVVVAVLLLAVAGVCLYAFSGKIPPPHKPEEIMVHLLPPPLPPPPPPPPPPKTPPPPDKPKMVEQPKVNKVEQKPKEAKNDKPPGPPGPKATGAASDNGLAGAGGGGDGIGGGDGGSSKFGWYAAQVQERIAEAMRQNGKTKDASLRIKIRVWADGTGRIVRATLSGSSGDASVDDAIKNEVLVGLRLQEPPPADMPMPIVMMLRAQRPS